MAERCHQYRAYQQKRVYLDQADRLSIILSDMARYKDDAKAYRNKIHAQRTKVTNSRSQGEPPETPKRNVEAPLFIGNLKDRFIRETVDVLTESRDEQPQSSREHHKEKMMKAVDYEVRFKKELNAQAKSTKTKKLSSDTTSILRKPISRDESDGSASGSTTQRVVSLANNQNESFLTETTYI